MKKLLLVLLLALVFPLTASADWPMAGANPQRTSWASQGVGGLLRGDWIKPIDAYISQKVQVVAAEDKVFLSTARGLYAFDAVNGDQLWVYPTSMPLAHSPTYVGGFLYIAGLDRKIHKVNATTGTNIWTYTAQGGFSVNPLVVNDVIYAGSRDGNMYAVSTNGNLNWKFDTGAPISQSAAYAPDTNTIYFGSDNMFAYAVNATTGNQVWKSARLPGMAMTSWWPVVNGSSVYFTVTINYKGKMLGTEQAVMYGDVTLPDGTPYGTVAYPQNDHMSMDIEKIMNNLNTFPNRRTLIILNRSNGTEKTPYAPFIWGGMTGSLNRYPPIVDPNGRMYSRNNTFYDGAIPGSHITGWKEGDTTIKIVSNRENGGFGDYPVDEPGALAAGGNILYHSHCCSRVIQSYDISIPNTLPLTSNGLFPITLAGQSDNRQWRAQNWKIPGWDTTYSNFFLSPYFSDNGGGTTPSFSHGENNPPIPYNGRVYVHRGNALMALSPSGTGQLKSTSTTVNPPAKTTRSADDLKNILAAQVQKIIAAGHLRPGHYTSGLQDARFDDLDPYFYDLFHNPAEMYIILLRAKPHLPSNLQTDLRNYLQNEWNNGFAATNVTHAGFNSGTPREYHEQMEWHNTFSNKRSGTDLINYYASWKYAQEFGNASAILNALPVLPTPLTESEFNQYPNKHNEYIAGYWGYCELYKMANNTSNCNQQTVLNSLITLRSNLWKFQPPNPLTGAGHQYYYAATIATNFMYLQPEFAHLLNSTGLANSVIAEYDSRFPLWFVAKGAEIQGEGSLQPPQYYHGLFQAKARILKQPYDQLEPYLDAPAYAIGDLYYIDNLVAVLEASPTTTPPIRNLIINWLTNTFDQNNDGKVNALDFATIVL